MMRAISFFVLTVAAFSRGDLSPRLPKHLVGKAFPPNGKELPTMPNVEYSLRGYNLLVGNPLASGHEADPGFDNVVFEAVYSGATTADLRYQIPDGYSVFSKTICNINFLSDTYSNEKHYQNELKVPINVDFSGWDAAFSANFEYKKVTEQMSTYEHTFVKTESTCGVYEVVMDAYKPPKFRSGFMAAVQGLAASTPDSVEGYEAYRRFVEVYGTHYIYSNHMGAKYAEQTEFTKTSRESLESEGINIDIAASYSALFNLGISTDTVIDTEVLKKFEEARLSKTIVSFGSRPPSDGSAISWTNSVFDEPLPISYRLLPITDLFTANFMSDTGIDFATIASHLKNFIKDYCTNEQEQLGISDCNGPKGGCAGGHECHHNAHCQDVEQNYECVCNDNYFGDGFSCSGWNIQTVLEPDVHGYWGNWGEVEMCPNNTFAYAFALKVEDEQPDSWISDDSALNGVKLYCRSSDGKVTGEVTSSVGDFGSWKSPMDCVNGFMNGFRFRAEGDIVGDDVMGTNMDGSCVSGEILEGQGINQWGSWSSWTYCPPEAAVCGLQTSVHPSQGDLAWEDDAGLTDMKLICCKT